MNMEPTGQFLVLNGLVFLAFALKGITGFGENLIMIPLFSWLMPLKEALPLTLVVVLAGDIVLCSQLYPFVKRNTLKAILVGAIPGLCLGVAGLTTVPDTILRISLGVLLVVYVAFAFIPIPAFKNGPIPVGWNYGAGLLGGLLSGLLGVGGPPVVSLLQHRGLSKGMFRATCVAAFLFFDLFRLGSYSLQGYMTPEAGLLGAALLPAFGAGAYAGFYLHRRLEERQLKA